MYFILAGIFLLLVTYSNAVFNHSCYECLVEGDISKLLKDNEKSLLENTKTFLNKHKSKKLCSGSNDSNYDKEIYIDCYDVFLETKGAHVYIKTGHDLDPCVQIENNLPDTFEESYKCKKCRADNCNNVTYVICNQCLEGDKNFLNNILNPQKSDSNTDLSSPNVTLKELRQNDSPRRILQFPDCTKKEGKEKNDMLQFGFVCHASSFEFKGKKYIVREAQDLDVCEPNVKQFESIGGTNVKCNACTKHNCNRLIVPDQKPDGNQPKPDDNQQKPDGNQQRPDDNQQKTDFNRKNKASCGLENSATLLQGLFLLFLICNTGFL